MKYIKLKHYNCTMEVCWMEIECPYCNRKLSLDSQNEPTLCQCGAKFHLAAIVEEVIEE